MKVTVYPMAWNSAFIEHRHVDTILLVEKELDEVRLCADEGRILYVNPANLAAILVEREAQDVSIAESEVSE